MTTVDDATMTAEEFAKTRGGNGATPPIRSLCWTLDDIWRLPAPTWMIEGFLQCNSKALIFGESGDYKTTHAVDAMCRVAHGLTYHGLAVVSVPVCFIANEDRYGLAVQRVGGWHAYHGRPSGRVIITTTDVKLDRPEHVEQVLAICRDAFGDQRPAFVIDTWDRSISGDPNSTQDINPALNGLDTLLAAGELTLTISHSPWSDKNRTKGAVSFWANHDTRILAERDKDNDRGTLKIIHQKNARADLELAFDFEEVKFDHQGTTTSTLIQVRDFDHQSAERVKTGKKQLPAKQQLALKALQDEAAATKRWEFTHAEAMDLWIRRGAIDGDKPANSQRARASDLRAALATRNLIKIEGVRIRLGSTS
jgi:hypothetical protein